MEAKKREGGKLKVLEGAEELLVEWSHALNKMTFGSREGLNTFREIEESAATHWLQKTIGKLPKAKTAYEAAIKFRDIADQRRVILKENFKLEEKGEIVLGTFLSRDCPYRKCCVERKREGKQYVCFRATLFVIAIKSMTDKDYKSEVLYEQTNPGRACIIRGVPTETAYKVGLSYKLSKGNVKLHEVDCKLIGIGIVDTVTIRPSRKEIADRKVTAMSYSQTRYPPGMILMNVADAKSLGLKEKDTVFIRKAGEEEEVTLVETEKYEIAGLEVSEEEKKEPTPEEIPTEPEKIKEAKEREVSEGKEEVEEKVEPEKEKVSEKEDKETKKISKRKKPRKKGHKIKEHEKKELERKIDDIRQK